MARNRVPLALRDDVSSVMPRQASRLPRQASRLLRLRWWLLGPSIAVVVGLGCLLWWRSYIVTYEERGGSWLPLNVFVEDGYDGREFDADVCYAVNGNCTVLLLLRPCE